MAPDSGELVARIYNAAYLVRYHARGGRSSIGREARSQAIRELGLAVRDAFNVSEDFEALLVAVFDGLSPKDAAPF